MEIYGEETGVSDFLGILHGFVLDFLKEGI